jgi:hypothetical protein
MTQTEKLWLTLSAFVFVWSLIGVSMLAAIAMFYGKWMVAIAFASIGQFVSMAVFVRFLKC